MKICEKIVIIGLGLIGASLGIALKRKKAASEIIGVSRKDSTLKVALRKKAVDKCSKDLALSVKDADMVILAAPVETIVNFASELKGLLKEDCIVLDVGSTKEEIVNEFEKKGFNFVGAHPLAGSEKQGPNFADGDLFKNSLCLITPTNRTKKQSLEKAIQLWRLAGARIDLLTPKQHDLALAYVSHLPHMVAFSLFNAVSKTHLKYAPKSFRDATRVAASDAHIWKDIFLSNREFILQSIDDFQASLLELKRLIKTKKDKQLFDLLKQVSLKRLSL